MSRIVVTGIGITSAIGEDLTANHQSLKNGVCGISLDTTLPSKYSGILPLAEIRTSTQTLRENLDVQEPGVTRTTLLALKALSEAIADAGLTAAQLNAPDTALIGASTVGGMCNTDELYRDANSETSGSPFLASYDCASVFLYLQQRYRIGGICNTINTACSSSANALMYGARLLRKGLAKRVIAGGVDSLAKFTINGFNSLRILSPFPCTPFDRDRRGLNLGEGAAFLVLEKESDITNRKLYAEFTGWGNANDAFHPSSLSEQGDGPFLSMKEAVDCAGVTTSDIGFINAHGTATENNDEVESRAMIRLFETVPPFASTKSNTGHTLGAAGAMGAVYSVLSLQQQEIYPSLHFSQPIVSTGLAPVQFYAARKLDHVMSNSFGFGGNCTSLIFSKA